MAEFNDYSISNNGKKGKYNKDKKEIKREDIDKKYYDIFDKCDDGDRVLRGKEISDFLNFKTTDADFLGFVKSITTSEENTDLQVQKKSDSPNPITPMQLVQILGINIKTEEGKIILERLSRLPKEAFERLGDGKDLKELLAYNKLEVNFDNLANTLNVVYGIDIREEEEQIKAAPNVEKLKKQMAVTTFLTNLYTNIAGMYDTYTDNAGPFVMGSELIGYFLNKIGLQGENHYQWASSCKEFAENSANLKFLNPDEFKKGFKNEIYGERSKQWGIDYNEEAFDKVFELAKNGKAYNNKNEMTKEYRQAIIKATNMNPDDPNDDMLNKALGFVGETLLMIMTLGFSSETQSGKVMATTLYETFASWGAKVSSQKIGGKALQTALKYTGKGIKLLGPALNEGTKMYTYGMTTGTGINIVNRMIKNEENPGKKFIEQEIAVSKQSTHMFVFAGLATAYGMGVTKNLMRYMSGTEKKIEAALTERLAKGPVPASEALKIAIENSAPTKFAQGVGFVSDVLGFTGVETAIKIAESMDGFPDNVTPEQLTEKLCESFKDQSYTVGFIRMLSYMILGWYGNSSAQAQVDKYIKESYPKLEGATIENIDGKPVIKLSSGDGIICENVNEAIAATTLVARNLLPIDKLNTIEDEQVENNVAEKTRFIPRENQFKIFPDVGEYPNFNFKKAGDEIVKYSELLEEIMQKYGIEGSLKLNPAYVVFFDEAFGETYYTKLYDQDNQIGFKFDPKTGDLVSISVEKENPVIENGKIKRNMAMFECEVYNLKNNTTTEMKIMKEQKLGMEKDPTDPIWMKKNGVPVYIEKTITSKDGKVLLHDVAEESEVPGEFNFYSIDKGGNKNPYGTAVTFDLRGRRVNRSFVSLNGTKTDYSFVEKRNGDMQLKYKITDVNGKVLFEKNRFLFQLSEDHYKSSTNGQEYDIVFTEGDVTVTRLDKNGNKTSDVVKYDIHTIPTDVSTCMRFELEPSDSERNPEVLKQATDDVIDKYGMDGRIDRFLLNTLLSLPGEEWFKMKNNGTRLVMHTEDNTAQRPGLLTLGEENRNIAALEHELGHQVAETINLDKDTEFLRIFTKEKNAFTAAFPDSYIASIGYFLEPADLGVKEFLAEVNLITNTSQRDPMLQGRSSIIQQYFPESIAYAANKMTYNPKP